MNDFRIELTRGELTESVFRVSVAVVDATGRVVASAGDPALVTFWRSAAKPFQAMPLLADGGADRFGLGQEELALACASHSSEPMHLEVVRRFLDRIGCAESDLACGPHVPLDARVAAQVAREGTPLTPIWSNCSGKHAGMLGLARTHEWPTAGYERSGHPVQERILDEVARWSDVTRDRIATGVDGCTTVCFALPLAAMALAYARFGVSEEAPARRLRDAMIAHPELVAGTGRLCTELMALTGGAVIAKIGAEGVYSAAIPAAGLGLTLKVESGEMRAAGTALLGVLRQLLDRFDAGAATTLAPLVRFDPAAIRNTRDEVTGVLRSAGALRFR
jgi:L-asparaginase II